MRPPASKVQQHYNPAPCYESFHPTTSRVDISTLETQKHGRPSRRCPADAHATTTRTTNQYIALLQLTRYVTHPELTVNHPQDKSFWPNGQKGVPPLLPCGKFKGARSVRRHARRDAPFAAPSVALSTPSFSAASLGGCGLAGSGAKRRFCGLMSQCTMPLKWR